MKLNKERRTNIQQNSDFQESSQPSLFTAHFKNPTTFLKNVFQFLGNHTQFLEKDTAEDEIIASFHNAKAKYRVKYVLCPYFNTSNVVIIVCTYVLHFI